MVTGRQSGYPGYQRLFLARRGRKYFASLEGHRHERRSREKNLWHKAVSFSVLVDFWSILSDYISTNGSEHLPLWSRGIARDNRSGLVWIHCFCILPWKMFLIRSIGCRVVYLTLLNIVCNGVYYMQPCVENFRKNRGTFHCRGRQSVRRAAYRRIEKFEATVTEVANLTDNIKTLSDVKEQLQTLKIHIKMLFQLVWFVVVIV